MSAQSHASVRQAMLTVDDRRLLRECAVDLIRASDLTDRQAVCERLTIVQRDLERIALRNRVRLVA